MKKIRFCFKAIDLYMKNQMQTKSYVLLDLINMFSRCFIVFLLYSYVFKLNNNNINGADLKTSLWSMFIYFCIMTFSLRKISNVIMNDVKSGNVETFINKPVNYIFLNFYKIIGEYIFSFLLISFVGTILMLITIGFPTVNLKIFIPTMFITFFLGQILALIVYSTIGVLAFFMQDTRPIYWIVDKMVMILGGSYLPVSLFPKTLKILAYVSPFGAINFATSTVFVSWNSEYFIRILIQIAWIFVFTGILFITYKKALKKAMINGG